MDFNTNIEIKEETEIPMEEALESLKEFIEENQDLEGILKIQLDETVWYLENFIENEK